MKNILKDLGLSVDNSKLESLFKRINKQNPAAKIKTREPGYIYQADLLFMPHDNEYKYILTVVDTYNNMVDAEPLKDKNAQQTLEGIKKVFSRKPLQTPKFSLETDPGGEFNNKQLIKYLNDKNILLRVGTRGRSNQQAIVELYNGIIAQILFLFMTNDELQTGETSRDWVDELPRVIEKLNKYLIKDKNKDIEKNVLFSSREEMIPIGTTVRTALNKPVGVADGKKLHGNFRKTDIKWGVKPTVVEDISLRPNQPVMYKTANTKSNYYTRNQLQIVNKDEKLPTPRKFIIDKIIEKIYKGKKPYFRIKWSDGSETEEPRSKLIKDIKQLVLNFEKKND
jgi:hypothetical protein